MQTKQQLVKHLTEEIRIAEKILEDFKCKFNENPHYALEWSMNAFTYSANLRVARLIISMLSNEENTIESVYYYIQKEILRGARNPEFSTSPTANLTHTLLIRSYARVAEYIKGGLL